MLIESRVPLWFLLARRYRLAYLQMPKAACSSLGAALCFLNHPELPRELVCKGSEIARHPEWTDKVRSSDPVLRGFFRFTFVRDPYVRFASFYRQKIYNRTPENFRPRFARMGLRAGMSVDEVLNVVETIPVADLDSHLAPQSSIVFAGGKPRVDFIGRIENLAAGLEEIATKTGTRLDVPRINVTVGTPDRDYREPLSEGARARVARLYAEDFERFGYER